MTSDQFANVCAFVARMALSRSDLAEWVESHRAVIEREIPLHAAGIIEGARQHYRELVR